MVSESAVRAVLEKSLKVRPEERLLVLTDTNRKELADPFHRVGSELSGDCRLEVMDPLGLDGQEPPEAVAKLMGEYHVQVLLTSKSLTHTRARREANEWGARIASMPGITKDVINRSLDVDYREMARHCEVLERILRGSRVIRVNSEMGTETDFSMGIGLHPDNGILDKPGFIGNLPAGEVSFAPEGVNGKFMADGSIPGLGKLDSPISFTVIGGRVTEIRGERAKELEEMLEKAGPKAYYIAELGIGTNPRAEVTGVTLEDEKALGTCHMALGNNLSYGGTNDVPIHLDCVIKKPTILVDGREIVRKGSPDF